MQAKKQSFLPEYWWICDGFNDNRRGHHDCIAWWRFSRLIKTVDWYVEFQHRLSKIYNHDNRNYGDPGHWPPEYTGYNFHKMAPSEYRTDGSLPNR